MIFWTLFVTPEKVNRLCQKWQGRFALLVGLSFCPQKIDFKARFRKLNALRRGLFFSFRETILISRLHLCNSNIENESLMSYTVLSKIS